ncbi:hypothetical protein [Rhizobium sp. PAMB 3182]
MTLAAAPLPSKAGFPSPESIPVYIVLPFVIVAGRPIDPATACHCGNLANDMARRWINNGKWGQKCVKLGQRRGLSKYAP